LTGILEEGWYLMSTADLERELARRRDPDARMAPSGAVRLSVEDALAYRNAGNLPDEYGRTLRLVLKVRDERDLATLDAKRLLYEPDYHDAPEWRREGSKPVNVVPLRDPHVGPAHEGPWWEQPGVAALEAEWREKGTVAGIPVSEAYRGFVHKTVVSLRAAGREVTPRSILDSLARWLPPDEVAKLEEELRGTSSG
jgi:hypothetical protein